jgi:ADP-ribosylglycohydrolase
MANPRLKPVERQLELEYDVYYDKVYGGWVGKSVGGAIGAQVEGQKRLHGFTEETAFPERWPPNDDLDLQVLWLHALFERGLDVESRDLAEEWFEHCWYHFCEYGRFLKNFARGIDPPTSGWFDNEYFRESMGSPIRSEVWAFISPGNPDLAASYAERDAVLDHWRDSVWAEQFYAAVEAAAFFESSLDRLVEVGLRYVPEGSKLRAVIELVRECRRRGCSWERARGEVLRRFGSPDATSVHQNVGFTLIALLWGELDFAKTALIALNCGYDTDCTAATALALLGVILGESRIPAKWKDPLNDRFEMGFHLPRGSYRISDLATETCAVGVAASRSLNRRVRILNVPGRVEEMARRVRAARPKPEVEVEVDYLGEPAVAAGGEKEIEVVVRNSGGEPVSGTLRLEVPEGWRAPPPSSLEVPPRGTRAVRVRVAAPAGGVLWDRNLLRAVFAGDGGRVWERSFGLVGARRWLVLGPFWDSPSWIEDAADVEKPYVDERLIAEGRELELFSGAVALDSPSSLIPLSSVVGFKGECCLYLLHRLYSPEEREVSLVVGAQGDVKVWLNGRLLEPSQKPAAKCVWHPFMYWFPAVLRRGENRVVVKYVKRTAEPVLWFDVHRENRERRPGYSVWQVDLGSVVG